jgi:hypothetical protein
VAVLMGPTDEGRHFWTETRADGPGQPVDASWPPERIELLPDRIVPNRVPFRSRRAGLSDRSRRLDRDRRVPTGRSGRWPVALATTREPTIRWSDDGTTTPGGGESEDATRPPIRERRTLPCRSLGPRSKRLQTPAGEPSGSGRGPPSIAPVGWPEAPVTLRGPARTVCRPVRDPPRSDPCQGTATWTTAKSTTTPSTSQTFVTTGIATSSGSSSSR